jgi:hypothetical protein
MWGDQWICKCGWHNFELRKKCRNCEVPKEEAIGEEGGMQVMDNVMVENLLEAQEIEGLDEFPYPKH